MNIIISGYGRMGREIEKAAQKHLHKITAKLDTFSDWDNLSAGQMNDAVIIDFSQPDVILQNIRRAFEMKIPMVTGTTGWDQHREEIKNECAQSGSTLFFSSNFSIGMNLFFILNKTLARLMTSFPEYNVEMEEIHHIRKLDKPSGTAITLAEQITKINPGLSGWIPDVRQEGKITIHSVREGEVPGTHQITYAGPADEIRILHRAKNRTGFAEGAIKAAQWLEGRSGYFEMEDMLKEELQGTIELF